MRTVSILLAAAATAFATPQGVTSAIAPESSPPPGCSENYKGSFLIVPTNVTSGKRDLEGRDVQLGIALNAGVLTDPQGRTGYIAENYQFQFDGPPQAGAIYTAGFSVCENKRLALGGTDIWYKCLVGDFYNLYFTTVGNECLQTYLLTRAEYQGDGPILPSSSSSSSAERLTGKSTSTATETGISTPSGSAATRSPSPTDSSGDLAPSVKIGVGVGVGVGVSCLLLGFGFLVYLRRGRRPVGQTTGVPGELSGEEKRQGELSAHEKRQELAAGRGQLPELPVKEPLQELPTER